MSEVLMVIVEVRGGVASVVYKPAGVIVQVRDYDIADWPTSDASHCDTTGEGFLAETHREWPIGHPEIAKSLCPSCDGNGWDVDVGGEICTKCAGYGFVTPEQGDT